MSEFLKLAGIFAGKKDVGEPDLEAAFATAKKVAEEARVLIFARANADHGHNAIEATIVTMLACQLVRGWLVNAVSRTGEGSIVSQVWEKLDELFATPGDEEDDGSP